MSLKIILDLFSYVKSLIIFELLNPFNKADINFMAKYIQIEKSVLVDKNKSKSVQIKILYAICLFKSIHWVTILMPTPELYKVTSFNFVSLANLPSQINLMFAAICFVAYYNLKTLFFSQECSKINRILTNFAFLKVDPIIKRREIFDITQKYTQYFIDLCIPLEYFIGKY